MKNWLRLFLISTFALWLVNRWFPEGLNIAGGTPALLKAGLGLMLANYLVRPLFNIIMLPINLLTFGLFRWIVNVAILWLVVKFIGGISIHPFNFNGITFGGIVIPALSFNAWTAWIAIPFLLSLISGLFIWLVKK